jgi:hypothetical protein
VTAYPLEFLVDRYGRLAPRQVGVGVPARNLAGRRGRATEEYRWHRIWVIGQQGVAYVDMLALEGDWHS